MKYKCIFQLKAILSLIFLILFEKVKSVQENDFSKYFFAMYIKKSTTAPYILHANTHNSEHLTIDLSKDDVSDMITKEPTSDYTNANFSSTYYYGDEYLVKTCFGSNKIVEIIPQNESESMTYKFNTENNMNISDNFVYCYSTNITNPDKTIQETSAIITYWVEYTSQKKYNHKCVLFYPSSKKFSKSYNLLSSSSFDISDKYPLHCTTFRGKDIFCSFYDSNDQFVIETNYIVSSQPSVFFVLADFGQIKGSNMKPISLNKEEKSILGGYYDVFLSEFHNNNNEGERNTTVLLYSLYRKSSHISLVPMYSSLQLFFGTNIRDAYIEINLFNYLIDEKEIILFFIYNKELRVHRIDYSVENNLFKRFDEIQNLGNFSAKLDNCEVPKYMQTTYFNNLIKYNSIEQAIVEKNKGHYKYEQDIAVLLSCSNKNSNMNEEISYRPIVIEMPQCLNYLDSMIGSAYHKINFFLSIDAIIYDIYADPRLKSFRNVGIMFYPIEQTYLGLITYEIKIRSFADYVIPLENRIYYDITHIKFKRTIPRYVPTFGKPFYLKYRLFNSNKSGQNISNNLASNICFFQIKFFPFNPITPTPSPPEEVCEIPYCAVCDNSNKEESKCLTCDTDEIEVIVKDLDEESETFEQCICDTSKGFYKEPNKTQCICQEFNAYYKSTDLCLPEKKLQNGPYYIEEIDDISNIPIYNDCYHTCKKCKKGGNAQNNNCLQCKEGYAFVDDDTSNCIDIDDLKDGYHKEAPDHYVKCHDNCVSCAGKPLLNESKQFCTECKSFVPYFIRDNLEDEYFNCLEKKCDENDPALMFAYSENSHECINNCDNGVQPYNNSKVCLLQCNNDFPFLELITKKCYSYCNLNTHNSNKIANVDKGTCENDCGQLYKLDNMCYSCQNKNMYKNKEGNCVDIPKECLVVDINTGLCKRCNVEYYPLKGDLDKESFNCYKSLDDITNKTNSTNFYLNKTEGYWDECYEACETCYGYGSENRQRCTKCKAGYHFPYYLDEDNKYNNCYQNLTPNQNCTSTQVDIYKYKDYCHLCKEGYSFVYGTEMCRLNEELNKTGFYKKEITIKIGDNRTEEITVKIYYPCYRLCKTCKEKGDYYDHKCTSCLDGYKFENEKHKKCIFDPDYVPPTEAPVVETEPLYSDEIVDSDENVWFKLGDNSYYMYKYKYCLVIFYEDEIFLINNKIDCINACPNWNRAECGLKNYTRFKNITKEQYELLIEKAHVYDEIKDNVNIIKISKDKKYHFHLTNYVSPPPKNMSYIHISKYQDLILKKFGRNILLMKVDIKRSDTQSTQVEYQFYNPNDIEEKVNLLSLISRRRLNNDNDLKLDIDLPVDWTDEQIENIQYLDSQNVNAFNSSEDFYNDNCNQFTSSNGDDVFVQERKKTYYPDIPLCEKDCTFVKFNSDTQKVTCQCNYKEDSENYDDVQFANNPIDNKFKKNIFLENFQAMKCIKTIFKWENLKANAGFIIMILFVIIFAVSLILYYLSGGASQVRSYIDKSTKDNNLADIIMRSNDKLVVKPFEGEIEKHPKKKLMHTPIDENPREENNGDLIDDVPKNAGVKANGKNPGGINKGSKSGNDNTNKAINSGGINVNIQSEDFINININKFNPNNPDSIDNNNNNNNDNNNSNGINNANNKSNDGTNPDSDEVEGKKNPNNNDANPIPNKNQGKEAENLKNSDNSKSLNKSLISSNNGTDGKKEGNEAQNKTSKIDQDKPKKKDEEDDIDFNLGMEINFGGENKPQNENTENKMGSNNNNNKNENSNNKNENDNDNNKKNNDKDNNNDLFSKNNDEDDVDKSYDIREDKKVNNNAENNKDTNNSPNDNNNKGNVGVEINSKDKNNDDDNNISNLNIQLITEDTQIQEEPNKEKEKDENKKKDKNKNPPKKKDNERHDSEVSDLSQIMKIRNDPDLYAKDMFDTESNNSIENVADLISLNSHKSNPPKKGNNLSDDNENDNDNNNNNNNQETPEGKDDKLNVNIKKISYHPQDPSSKAGLNVRKDSDEDQKKDNKNEKYLNRLINKEVNINEILKYSDDILTLEEFGNKYSTFPSIYVADLKKHHLIYFTFIACNDYNNLLLKLSYFSLSINLYFFINTCLIFNSNMSDAYYGQSNAKAQYILMNLLLPFIICGLISFLIKRKIMPQYVFNEITKKIQSNEILRNYYLNRQIKKEDTEKPKKRRHNIKNQRVKPEIVKAKIDLEKELQSIYSFYWKKVLIYFIAASIFLAFNWYMMTSFCAIFRNTGVKLILNSFISLFASFILPCILAILPTLLGVLAIKTKKELFYKIYKTINYLL